MDDVVSIAQKLSDLLASDPRTKALREASAAVTSDAEAKTLEEEYAHAAAELRDIEMSGSPIEPEMKRRFSVLTAEDHHATRSRRPTRSMKY